MSTDTRKILEAMPIHSDGSEGKGWQALRIEGLVSRPLNLTSSDLSSFPTKSITDDFRCTEGWIVPDQRWEGVPLSTLIEMANPAPNSNYVSIHAGDYVVGLTLYEVYNSDAILAFRLNDETLPLIHGGPCRLIASGKQCYFSVKWVDRIEITAMQPNETGLSIASARNR